MTKPKFLCLLCCIYIMSCASPQEPTEFGATEHSMLRSLMEAGSWPNVQQDVVVNLVVQFNAFERYSDGSSYFDRRAEETVGRPEHPWMLAAAGLFQVQNNMSVAAPSRKSFVREGVAKLDAAVAEETGIANYFRGIILSNLPDSFEELDRGIEDLEFVLGSDDFPNNVKRGALKELAKAYERSGETERAAMLFEQAGHSGRDHESTLGTDFSVTQADGFRFGVPQLKEIGEGVWVAPGFDFGDMAFIETPEGIVVIDAGTHPENAEAVLRALREVSSAKIRTLVLTHAHWDHIGGASVFAKDGVEVIVESHFDEERESTKHTDPPVWFFGEKPVNLEVQHTRVIDQTTTLEGEREIVLIPVKGGETEDAILVHLPDEQLAFTGDIFMPYLGAPFTEEGNPEALLETIDTILSLSPRKLIHGHVPLTRLWKVEQLPALRAGLAALVSQVNQNIKQGKALHQTLNADILPMELTTDPNAVLPFLVMREGLIKRLYDLRTGYWQPGGRGVETLSDRDWGRALAASAGEAGIVEGVRSLMRTGEAAMPYRMVEIGLLEYPNSEQLKELSAELLQRLRSVNHQTNPFKFILYSEEADSPLQPLVID